MEVSTCGQQGTGRMTLVAPEIDFLGYLGTFGTLVWGMLHK